MNNEHPESKAVDTAVDAEDGDARATDVKPALQGDAEDTESVEERFRSETFPLEG